MFQSIPELLGFLIYFVIIFGIILPIHEFAHAYAAYKLGDPTAKYAGRMTLNPLVHLDLWGALIFLVTRGIGWGKPVPVNTYNLKHRRGESIVSLAGPLSNFALALVLAVVIAFFPDSYYIKTVGSVGQLTFYELMRITISISVTLGIFNLIPIPPLDGSKILFDFLPPAHENLKRNLESDGPIILLIFFLTQLNGGVFFSFVSSITLLFFNLADFLHGMIY